MMHSFKVAPPLRSRQNYFSGCLCVNMKFGTDIHGLQRIAPDDLFYSTVIETELLSIAKYAILTSELHIVKLQFADKVTTA